MTLAFNPCPCAANGSKKGPQIYQVREHARKQPGFYALCTCCTREIYARSEESLCDFWNRSSQDIKATYAPHGRYAAVRRRADRETAAYVRPLPAADLHSGSLSRDGGSDHL